MDKWNLYYKYTINNIINNINIYKQMICYYCKIIIENKLEDIEYIRQNYNINIKYNLFKKYILEEKNLGIFTIFNNIPDIIHPMEDDLYLNYGLYLSFIKPSKFNLQNDDIIIKNTNIYKFKYYKDQFLYQDTAPYNTTKKYIYINIKYFNFSKYIANAIVFISDTLNIYSYNKNILKIKKNNEWFIINKKITDFNNNIIYASVLRTINESDITNTFNSFYKIKKNTNIYSNNKNEKCDLLWFSLNNWEFLNDPYKIWNKQNDLIYQDIGITIKNFKCLNLSIDILSNNKINKTIDISELLNNSLNSKNIILNGNLNYIKYKSNKYSIWYENRGKRLLHEIYLKSSNFNLSNKCYFDFLSHYNFNYFVNTVGYYDKLDKFYTYELGFNNNLYTNKLIKIIERKKVHFI